MRAGNRFSRRKSPTPPNREKGTADAEASPVASGGALPVRRGRPFGAAGTARFTLYRKNGCVYEKETAGSKADLAVCAAKTMVGAGADRHRCAGAAGDVDQPAIYTDSDRRSDVGRPDRPLRRSDRRNAVRLRRPPCAGRMQSVQWESPPQPLYPRGARRYLGADAQAALRRYRAAFRRRMEAPDIGRYRPAGQFSAGAGVGIHRVDSVRRIVAGAVPEHRSAADPLLPAGHSGGVPRRLRHQPRNPACQR